jgi:hypothetical protein
MECIVCCTKRKKKKAEEMIKTKTFPDRGRVPDGVTALLWVAETAHAEAEVGRYIQATEL